MAAPDCSSHILLLLLLLLPDARTYEAPQVKQDVFAARACAAFLTFTNAAYLSGVTVELPCHCKPEQVRSVVWFFRRVGDDWQETKPLADLQGRRLLDPQQVLQGSTLQSRFSIRLFSLLLFRAGPEDSGIYICGSTRGWDFFYAYDLDIQEARMLSVTPRSSNSSESRHFIGPDHQVFTAFQPWSVCDRCGMPGEQIRIGLCYVHSQFLHVRYRRANQTVASCGSGGVPRAIRRLIGGRGGGSLEFRSCQVSCPTGLPLASETISLLNFLGFSSATANVPVFYVNHPADSVLTLGCPKAQPNLAVAWDQGSTPVYRSKLTANGTRNPRLQIDSGHHLVFNPAKTEDSGTYTCWLQGLPTAQIRLLIYPHFGQGQSVMSLPDFPAAVQLVMTSFAIMTCVFCLLLFIRAARNLRTDGEMHLD